MPVLLMIVLAVIFYGEDCPRFRGPVCDGMFSETGLMKKWHEGGPKLAWSGSDILNPDYST